ncbi:MAG: hypothetical protein QME12_02110 [Nanoarchaeota archaeon]|nr:hypothetical protein [Nanoarchaeota archaeon]
MPTQNALMKNLAGKRQKFTGLFASILLALALVLSLLLVFLFRAPESMLPGTEAYFLVRSSAEISFEDALSFGGRFAAYPMGARAVLSIAPDFIIPLVPFILGAISFLLFMLLLKDFEIKPKKLILAVLIASPSFLWLFNTLNSASFAVCIALLGFWLFSRKSFARCIAIPVFMLAPLFDFTIGILCLALLFFYGFFMLKKKGLLFVTLAFSVLASAAYYGWLVMNTGFERLLFETGATGFNAALSAFISELGANYGIGIFALMLAVFGIIAHWHAKYRNLFVFFSVSLLFVTSFFAPKAIFLLNFFIAVFAAYGFADIYNSRWENKVFRNFVLLILACGLLFSYISYSQRFVAEEPNPETLGAMEYIGTLPAGAVFSDYSRGHWISFAGKKNVMDENLWLAPNVNQRWQDSQELLNTRDLEKAMQIISKYNINYIWIDNEIMQKHWKSQEEGLMFLLKYSKSNFRKSYDKEGVQVWEVIG